MFMRMINSAIQRLTEGKDDRRFFVAVGVSILLHAYVLQLWQQQHLLSKPPGDGSLTVSFRKTPNQEVATTRSPPPVEVQSETQRAPLVQAPSSPVKVRPERASGTVSPQGAKGRTAEQIAAGSSVSVSPRALAAGSPRATVRRNPGEVSVLIVMGDNGRPGQIIWGELPAMNSAQLQIIESRIRSRIYANALSGSRLMEDVNVDALLREISSATQTPQGEASVRGSD